MPIDLSRFDLNLLKALDALLNERNVTRAASRLFVTQQAASGALQRLRSHFKDELLTQIGRHLELTPLAHSLVRPVRETLLAAQTVLATRPVFDPSKDPALCRIAMSDYGLLVLLPPFLQRLAKEAPHVKCLVEPLMEGSFVRLDMGDLDFCMTAADGPLYGIHRPSCDIRNEPMFRDDFVCVFDSQALSLGPDITLEDYCRAKHNSVAFGQGITTLVESAWIASGLDMEVVVVAPSFSALILMLPGTPFLATTQRRLAISLAQPLGLKIVECPLPIAVLQESLMWHERSEADPKHIFFRSVLRAAAMDVNACAPLNTSLTCRTYKQKRF